MSLRRRLAYLKRHPVYLLVVISGPLFLALTCYLGLRIYRQRLRSAGAASQEILIQGELNNQQNETEQLKEPLTVLLLGLDSRRGDQRPRCDAIHLITFSPPEKKIIITSVPRGIHVDLEGVATPSAYLGNSCHLKGISFAIEEIVRITGLQPDYLAKINFSQALGIFRLLDMPTTPTLQFLRDRKSYLYGDNQRSYNQALFIKDMIINHLDQVAGFPEPVKQLLFRIGSVEGLEFKTAQSVLNWMVKVNFADHPEKIELVTKPEPSRELSNIHFAETDFPNPDSWQNNQEFQAYQEELRKYLENLVSQGEKQLEAGQKEAVCQLLKTPVSQQLWLQLEESQLRNQLHFELLRLYSLSLEDQEEAVIRLKDFIKEMETAQETDLKKQAEELLTACSLPAGFKKLGGQGAQEQK